MAVLLMIAPSGARLPLMYEIVLVSPRPPALRGGREEDALPLLRRAAGAGVHGAALARGRIAQRRAGDEAAARLCHRYGSAESMLRLAEAALDADRNFDLGLNLADLLRSGAVIDITSEPSLEA